MNFIPDQSKIESQEVPYFDNVTTEDGWQGHSTGKSIERLKQEVITALTDFKKPDLSGFFIKII